MDRLVASYYHQNTGKKPQLKLKVFLAGLQNMRGRSKIQQEEKKLNITDSCTKK